MVANPKAVELEKKESVEYEWGTLWPHYHKEKMNWATGFRTKGDVDILFLSGSTGRDPFGKGKVVGGIKEQTRQALDDIKGNLELMGATLKNIVMFRYYLKLLIGRCCRGEYRTCLGVEKRRFYRGAADVITNQ